MKKAHQAFHWFVTDSFFLIRQYNRLAEEAESLLSAIEEELR